MTTLWLWSSPKHDGLIDSGPEIMINMMIVSLCNIIGLTFVCSAQRARPPGEQVRAVLADEGLAGVARSIVPPGPRLPPAHKHKNICMILKIFHLSCPTSRHASSSLRATPRTSKLWHVQDIMSVTHLHNVNHHLLRVVRLRHLNDVLGGGRPEAAGGPPLEMLPRVSRSGSLSSSAVPSATSPGWRHLCYPTGWRKTWWRRSPTWETL